MVRGKKIAAPSNGSEDKYRSILTIRGQERAGKFVREHPLDLVVTELVEKGAEVRLTYYLTQAQIKTLRKAGYEPEVMENVSTIGRERQAEVGKGDRFEGGRIAPKSRGVTLREEQ